MKTKTDKIIFMGSPDFAVPSLIALYENGYQIPLVVTQPDRPKGRGRKIVSTPVKETAIKYGIPVVCPQKIKDPDLVEQIRLLQPDWFVVVAYGHILTKDLLAIPRKGAINIHASLLPQYRGSAPIQQAIIDGQTQTGITTIMMDKGMDTGDILVKQAIAIKPDDTASTLHDRLSTLGSDVILKTLTMLAQGELVPVAQDNNQVTYAPMLKKDDGHIDWNLPAQQIECLIRGVTPWPGAFTFLNEKRIKIFKVKVVDVDANKPPGTVLYVFPAEMIVAAGDKGLSILELQGASGKRLAVREFLKGNQISEGDRFI